jgi:hypothetical protein
MECDQVNIKAAFLNEELQETIFMELPEGGNTPHGKVIRLRKSLYGLRQSPRSFNQSFDKWMKSEGFTPTQADPCLYIYKQDKITMLVSLHVEDQLIACNDRPTLNDFRSGTMHSLNVQIMNPSTTSLGFICDRQARTLDISQEHYVEALLERFDMTNCNPVRTPLSESIKPVSATDGEHATAKNLDFPGLAGSVL